MSELSIEYVPVDALTQYDKNAKLHPQEQIDEIKSSITRFGMNDPIAVCGKDNTIVDGHGRFEACKQLGMEEVPVIRLDHLTEDERKAYTLVHNKITMDSGFDLDLLNSELQCIDIDMSDFDFNLEPVEIDMNISVDFNEPSKGSLNDKFIVPPFSILDARQGYWTDRKRLWNSIGIHSELGREDELLFSKNLEKIAESRGGNGMGDRPQTSIFDPVLCELVYKWFNVDGGKVFDCFAGGSVRGIVASKLGFEYVGIDLRKEQVDANIENAKEIGVSPKWYCDDSLNADKYVDDASCDLIFSCPPYFDLEVYSDDPRDISNMDYDSFSATYRKIISIACKKLKNNRFAVFVVGDVRDKKGGYRGFVDLTKKCFTDEGLIVYNDMVLVQPVGTAAIRASNLFEKTRKTVKTHQNVLVFYKGDQKKIKDNYPSIDVDIDSEENLLLV